VNRPLMFDAMSREFLLCHMASDAMGRRWPPWITDRPPPGPGFYLVSVDHSEGLSSTRLERWDGAGWPLLGGYCTVKGWMFVPDPLASAGPIKAE
jgi:hypothetical protein